MVSALLWERACRIIPSRFPWVGIFDQVSSPADLPVILELEAATNPRVLDEAGILSMVRTRDRIAGEGTTPIMAAFTHTRPSRFSDGTYGVYYAGNDEATAIAETAYHRSLFLRYANLRSEIVQMRVYTARIEGSFEDLRRRSKRSPLYDPDSYAASQIYARKLFERDVRDGIVYASVRRSGGECVAAFRPRCISFCTVTRHLEYYFEDFRLTKVLVVKSLISHVEQELQGRAHQ